MVNDIFIAADETTASGDTICWFTSRFSLYSITVGTSASETINVRIRVHQPSSSCFRSRSSQYLYNIVVKFVIIQRGPKVSTHTLGLKPPPCFIFEGTYLFEDSVTKIWKFDFLGPHPINIRVLILVFVNILETLL